MAEEIPSPRTSPTLAGSAGPLQDPFQEGRQVKALLDAKVDMKEV